MGYPVGTKFIRVGKQHVETITDILTTYNSKGEKVKTRYVSTYEFCGQTITDSDVIPVTVARGIDNMGKNHE